MEENTAKNLKILCIEDDQFISEMYVRSLKKAGYDVDFAVNGKIGLEKAKSNSYDLVLLDIFLPEISGIDVLREIHTTTDESQPHTKVVLMTNYAHDDESRSALLAQADGYFIKADVTPKKLVELVQQMIG